MNAVSPTCYHYGAVAVVPLSVKINIMLTGTEIIRTLIARTLYGRNGYELVTDKREYFYVLFVCQWPKDLKDQFL